MRRRSYILLLLVVLIAGCKSKRPVINMPPAKHYERTTTKLIPFYIPADSTALRAYFECDSLNNVLLKSISESKSPRVDSDIDFNDGVFDYRAKAQPDTVYLPSDSVYVYVIEPYPVEVESIEYKQTKLQRIFYMIGIILTTAGAVWGLTRLGMKRIF